MQHQENADVGSGSFSRKSIKVDDADTLETITRSTYESTLYKLYYSLCFAGVGLLFLGMSAVAGGQSKFSQLTADNTDGDVEDAYQAAANGYAFACFSFLVAFILASIGSIIISPVICGSSYEKLAVTGPTRLDNSSS